MFNLLAVVILFSVMLFSSVVKADTSNWMADLDGEALITQIAIPGTHDSAATYDRCGTGAEYCHAQTYGFTDQLSKGIRFFDIRIANKDGDLEFHHNIYDLDINFKDAVDSVQEFLSYHDTEFVIFLIKQETWTNDDSLSTDEFWDKIHEQLNDYDYDYDKLFYFSQSGVPTVDEVRGKIVIMAREKPSNYPGSDPYHVAWDNNTLYYEGYDGHLKYVVEDHWSMGSVPRDEKFADIVQNLYLAGFCAADSYYCCDKATLFITFLSGNGVKSLGLTPGDIASYENEHTADWLKEKGGYHPGVVAMDFGGDSGYDGDLVVQEVINQNF